MTIKAKKAERKTEPTAAVRIYCVRDLAEPKCPLKYARAPNMSQAVSYVTRGRFEVWVATQEDLLGVDPNSVINATDTKVHPDQQPLTGVDPTN